MKNTPIRRHILRSRQRKGEEGVSLVLTLTLIVLVTFASVAFFSRTAANSSIENARVGQIYTEQISESGVDHVLSLFLSEITGNSILVSNGSSPNYLPASNAAMVPSRSVCQASMLTDTNFANLIRQSVAGAADSAVSTHSSGTPSRDGRVVDTNRWTAPYLITGGFGSTNQLPSWIYVNRDGTITDVPSANAIGRFAYNAYDIGGLLDANAAGAPSGSSSSQMSVLKGTQAGADLTRIAGMSQAAVDSLVAFRNPQSTNATAYADYVPGAAAKGYLEAVVTNASGTGTTTNVFFASRQDLIRYAQNQNTAVTNALPYLTHFSRELARPSLTNNGLLAMTTRYDLSRVATPTNVGLSGSAPTYTYANPLPANLSVTNPDLFQILGAAVSYTNSWETNGPTNAFAQSSSVAWATNANLKAVAIGANVIDQFNGTTSPIRITYTNSLGSFTMAGKKQLPAVMQVFLVFNKWVRIGGEGEYDGSDEDDKEHGYDKNGNNGEAVGNPGTGNNGNDMDRGNAGNTNSNSITFYVSVIPQVWIGGSPVRGATLTASLGGGTLSLPGVTNVALPTNIVTVVTTNGAGASPVYANPTATNPVTRGFFSTNVVITKSISTSLTLTLTNLSITLKAGSNTASAGNVDPTYNAFGTNSAWPSVNTNASLASATFSGTFTLTNLVNTNITAPKTNQLAGIAVVTLDPRTLRGAGETVVVTPIDPSSLTIPRVAASTPSYPSSITDTNWISPTNRINSVGELGYVFRESPWRSVDFVSTNSADRNLLDVFSAYPTPASGIRAGVVNLNTRQPVVLAALLSGTPTTGSGSITPATAATYASNMVASTMAAPLVNRTKLIDLVSSNVIATAGDTLKQSREAAIRALGEVGQTRTWNILIDVVAQNGKFTGAGTESSDFSVAGERRVWVSAAIDRITGRIIDRQTEQVGE